MLVLYELERDAKENKQKALDALDRLVSITYYISEKYMELDKDSKLYPDSEDTPVSEDLSKVISFGNFYHVINKCLISLDLNQLTDNKPEEEIIDSVIKNIKASDDIVCINQEKGLIEFTTLMMSSISYLLYMMKHCLESTDPYIMDAVLLNYRFGVHGLIESDAKMISNEIYSYVLNTDDINNLKKDITEIFKKISNNIVDNMKKEEGLDY